MSKILYVVHRYAPFPGGSEYYVRDMAEESLKRGHEVAVLTQTHQGDLNGVRVSDDYQNILNEKWDLIVVHGSDVISQDIVHINSHQLQSPVCHMIIKPSDREIALHGMKHNRFLAYSTSMDIEHIKKHGYLHKARRVRHGVVPETTIVPVVGQKKDIYVSAGGFYPHKAMIPLAEAFERSSLKGELHLYGYIEGELPKETDRVKVFFGKSKAEVMSAINDAKAYIMNSYEEGFGLVLLESMLNHTPWFARNIAGAKDMATYGYTYETEEQLMYFLETMPQLDAKVKDAYNYAMANHTIVQTVNDIEDVILEMALNA
jgi:glycosyltransferase involved in cell wall biosynthesis